VDAILNGKVFDKNNSQFISEAQLRYQLVLPTSQIKKNNCEGKKDRKLNQRRMMSRKWSGDLLVH
jgi:hypothetical protein